MLDNLKTDKSIDDEIDVLGGKYILESDIYPMTIDMAYMDKSSGGATSMNLLFKGQNGTSLRTTLWVTSGTAKGGNNYYTDTKGNKKYLPGFNQANALALLSVGKELSKLTPEKKTINVYDFNKGKEVPMEKEVLMELLGSEVTLGVVKQIVDKKKANDAGIYVPTGETREENEIVKVFRTKDNLTTAEIRAEATESVFMDKWLEKNRGTTVNKSSIKDGVVTTGVTSTPSTTENNGEGTKSLFGDNE